MTTQDAAEVVDCLISFWPSPAVEQKTVAMWCQALEPYSVPDALDALNDLSRTSKFRPAISEIADTIKAKWRRSIGAKPDEPEKLPPAVAGLLIGPQDGDVRARCIGWARESRLVRTLNLNTTEVAINALELLAFETYQRDGRVVKPEVVVNGNGVRRVRLRVYSKRAGRSPSAHAPK